MKLWSNPAQPLLGVVFTLGNSSHESIHCHQHGGDIQEKLRKFTSSPRPSKWKFSFPRSPETCCVSQILFSAATTDLLTELFLWGLQNTFIWWSELALTLLKTELPQLAALVDDALVTNVRQDICLGKSFTTLTQPALYSWESKLWQGSTDAQEEGTATWQKWDGSSLDAEYLPEVFCLLGVKGNGVC